MITDNNTKLTLDQKVKGKEERDSQTINELKRVCTPEKLGITRPTSLSCFARTRPLVKMFIIIILYIYYHIFRPFFMSLY